MTTTHDSHAATPTPPPEPKLAAVIAQFETPEALIDAAKKVRDAGYKKFDAHSPFPVHGIDEAMGIRRTVLPWLTLGGAAAGVATALGLQYIVNSIWYPFLISGKPIVSVPSMMPVTFELGVLFAAFATLFGMFALNGLPFFSPSTAKCDRFRRVTSDKFFIFIDAADRIFSRDRAVSLLESAGATSVEECWIEPAATKIPSWFWLVGIVVFTVLLIPPAIIAKMRTMDSRSPRIHVIQDMDFQTKYKTQKVNEFFADRRAMRPQVAGTIARGDLGESDPLYRGLEPGTPELPVALVSLQQPAADGAKPADGAAPPAAPDPLDQLPWVTKLPVEVNEKTMARGQERYNIYCANCHGLAGDGDGLITLRAMELQQGTWIKPVSYHTDPVRKQPIGRLFHSITNGVRKMPPMGDVIPVEDRWAILLYVRALQRSRNSTLKDVPADLVSRLTDLK